MSGCTDPMLPPELQATFDAVPPTELAVTDAQREAAWQRLRNRLHDPARVPFTDEVKAPIEIVRDGERPAFERPAVARPDVARSTHVRSLRGMAAAAALLLTAGATAWSMGDTTYEVASGASPQQITLDDGSTAWVAPGASLRVSRRLGWPSLLAPSARQLTLNGEAYFDVTRDGRPFLVRAADVEVQVLGTRFSVRGGDGFAAARVEVNEGRVAVQAGGVRELLAAGEGVMWRAGMFQRRSLDAAKVASWRTGGLAALDEPLGDVIDELARRFGVEISIDRDVDTSSVVSLFYPSAPTVDVVLGDLCTAQSLAFQRTSRGYRIGRL